METDTLEDECGDCFSSSQLHIFNLPDSILLHIFQYLPFSSVCQVSKVCHRWNQVSSDELLWRSTFLRHFKLPFTTNLPIKAESWRSEFKRLFYFTPALLVEELKDHKDEVLHVSFSHDGTMFATCSKDGYFMIWNSETNPVRLLFKMDMRSRFSWQFTQFSQFNENDTCLLVSGVYRGRFTTSGEIAIFNLQDNYEMQSRVTNKPYDVFGAWYDNDHLLSGTIYITENMSSVSAIWLSKACQEVESEMESVSMVLYRFQNHNSSTVRLLNVAEIEKAGVLPEDTVTTVDMEEKLSCECSEFEPSLLDRLLCREISEEEFDLENEDCDDGNDDNHGGAELEEDEDDEFEDSLDSMTGEEGLKAESLQTLNDMDWVAIEGSSASACNNLTKSGRISGGKNSLENIQNLHNDALLFSHNVDAVGNNSCHVSSSDFGRYELSSMCDALTSDSSNNASCVVSKTSAQSSPSSARSDSCQGSLYRNMSAPVHNEDNLFLDAISPEETPYETTYNCDNNSSSENSAGHASQATDPGCSVTIQNGSRSLSSLNEHQQIKSDKVAKFGGRHLKKCCRNGFGGDTSTKEREAGSDIVDGGADVVDGSAAVVDGAIAVVGGGGTSWRGQNRPFEWPEAEHYSNGGSCDTSQAKSEAGPAWSLSGCRGVVGSEVVTGQHSESELGAPSVVGRSRSSREDSLQPGDTPKVKARKGGVATPQRAPHFPWPPAPGVDEASAESLLSGTSPITQKSFHGKASTTQTSKSEQCRRKTSKACESSSSCRSQQHPRGCKRPPEKLLIYTWGTKTYTPHKIGIKRIKWTDFSKGEVTARRSSMLPSVLDSLQNGAERTRRDEPDHSIEMHGHIVGLRVAPDHRYLYVNCRPWPENYIISDSQESPPLAQEVEISTIDLKTFEFVGPVLRSHKAFTHSDDCFFLSVDVSDDFVVSGAEDKQGYLWDRYYGIPLYRFPHNSVVNCVAVNPRDPEMLVTVSDDFSIKVWVSRHKHADITQHSPSPSQPHDHQSLGVMSQTR